jgi:SAM-dependent methyltransferase
MGSVAEPSLSSAASGYLFDNRASQTGQRFDSLAELFNPVTFRHLDALGIAAGWHCWEVGVGGPSVPEWLSSRVGPSGHVLATDIDVTWTQRLAGGNVEVLQHDVAADDAPQGGFDLVHARLVLIHVPKREVALERMARALRPGGWLLMEDFDPAMQPLACVDVVGIEQRRANKVRAGVRALLAQRGADLELGRRLPRLLREAGLELERANVNQVREGLIAGGHVTVEEIDAHLQAVEAGRLDLSTAPLISAWGRRP